MISDRRPILLESGDWDATPSYFKFENMWLQSKGFVDKLKNWWQSYNMVGQSYNFSGRADFILLQKLKSLNKDITRWNKEEFGKVETRKTRALDELMALEQMTEGRQLTLIESNQMMRLRVELQQLAKAEEISWRQKSRLLVGNEIIEDKELIKAEILDFYGKLYTEQENWRPSKNFEGIATITTEEKNGLEAPFDEDEVLAAIQSSAPDKAPRPDGFTMAFYQHSWEFIKHNILTAMNHYH
ncbi:uncharacterized protein LOC142172597 [Nicotiana tabacum]|uniref:Uncharacterized protein LOC142172597 n=1 Tax=Nicotiana tabacum TaxID=4097 RepID=A0AC58T556_TOBAC